MAQKRSITTHSPPTAMITNQKNREVAVVKHYHPNPARQVTGTFPKVRYCSELPEGHKYYHLHPVFKFVDNFLSNTSLHCGRTSNVSRSHGVLGARKAGTTKAARKCTCISDKSLDQSGPSPSARPFTTKKSPAPLSRYKQTVANDRAKSNVNNANHNSIIRVSMKTNSCLKSRKSTDLAQDEPSLTPLGSDYYVESIKKEIRESRIQVAYTQSKPCSKVQVCIPTHPGSNYTEDTYIQKLKDEIVSSKIKCVEDARNLINELQNEILTYRLQTKVKYSSSCSDINCAERNQRVPPTSRESAYDRKIGEGLGNGSVMNSPRDGSNGCKQCETIWQSKGSFPSSTETTLVYPVTQEINFEEKLHEANCLIEKVKEALKDISKGINKMPEQKKALTDSDDAKSCPDKCIEVACSFHGRCPITQGEDKKKKLNETVEKNKIVEQAKSEDLKQPETQEEESVLKEAKEESVPKEAKEETSSVLPQEEIVDKEVEEEEQRGIEEENEEKEVVTIKPIGENVEYDETVESVSESMDVLQAKLNTISEISETDSVEKIVRTERGSSPIDFAEIENLEMQECKDEISKRSSEVKWIYSTANTDASSASSKRTDEVQEQVLVNFLRKRSSSIEPDVTENLDQISAHKIPSKGSAKSDNSIQKSVHEIASKASQKSDNFIQNSDHKIASKASEKSDNSIQISVHKIGSKASQKSDNSVQDSAHKIASKASEKSGKLSVQIMPPVSIRTGLVIQRTLHLCIKATGSVSNEMPKKANIGYQEVNRDVRKSVSQETLVRNHSHLPLCPEDCKNPDGGYCKAELALKQKKGCRKKYDQELPGHDSLHSQEERKSGLDDDTMLMFRSFQIMESDKYEKRSSQLSLATLTHNVARSIQNLERAERRQDSILGHDIVDGGTPMLLPTSSSDRNPWEIGFYKTKGTQCNEELIRTTSWRGVHSPQEETASQLGEHRQVFKQELQRSVLDALKVITAPGPLSKGALSVEDVQKVISRVADVHQEPGLNREELESAFISFEDTDDQNGGDKEEDEEGEELDEHSYGTHSFAESDESVAVEKPKTTEKPVRSEQRIVKDDGLKHSDPKKIQYDDLSDDDSSTNKVQTSSVNTTSTAEITSPPSLRAGSSRSSSRTDSSEGSEEPVKDERSAPNVNEILGARPDSKDISPKDVDVKKAVDKQLDRKKTADSVEEKTDERNDKIKTKRRVSKGLYSSSSSSSNYSSHVHGSVSSRTDESAMGTPPGTAPERPQIGVKRSHDLDNMIKVDASVDNRIMIKRSRDPEEKTSRSEASKDSKSTIGRAKDVDEKTEPTKDIKMAVRLSHDFHDKMPKPKDSKLVVTPSRDVDERIVRNELPKDSKLSVGVPHEKASKDHKVAGGRSRDLDEKIIKSETPKTHRRSSMEMNVPLSLTSPVVSELVHKKKGGNAEQEDEDLTGKQKMDANIQVFLGSSSSGTEETTSESSAHEEAENDQTLTSFIKGLTGTSRDQLQRLRSNPSFPKSELSSWSKTVLKTIHENDSALLRNLSSFSRPDSSVVKVHKHKKDDGRGRSRSRDLTNPSKEQVLHSEGSVDKAKIRRLKDGRELVREQSESGDKKLTDKIVMSVTEETRISGEGDDLFQKINKRHLPFYRRMFSRIIDRPSKTPMRVSHSHENSVDDSWSEGEIKCKNACSIGEVIPYKSFINERKKVGKSEHKHVKKYPNDIWKDSGERSLKLWQEREEYNEWISHYLQKLSAATLDDSSSSTPGAGKSKE